MIINIIEFLLLPCIAYCLLMMYRNELVCAYRLRYIDEHGPYQYDDDLPSYDEMLKSHIVWSVVRLRRYVKRGVL